MHLTPGTDQTITLALGPTLNAEYGQTFRMLVRQALEQAPTTLDIDMGDLTFIDSTGLGMLTLTRNEAEPLGCEVRLINLRPGHPRKVIELMCFDKLFTVVYAKA